MYTAKSSSLFVYLDATTLNKTTIYLPSRSMVFIASLITYWRYINISYLLPEYWTSVLKTLLLEHEQRPSFSTSSSLFATCLTNSHTPSRAGDVHRTTVYGGTKTYTNMK